MSKHSRPEEPVGDLRKESTVLGSAPIGRSRVITNTFIVCWLTWQVVLPLSYYVGDRVDDERFSWRMFSGIWLLQKSCTVSVTESLAQPASAPLVRQVNLERTLHATWVGQLKKKNRQLVVEKFLRKRCEKDPAVVHVEYARTCGGADSRIPPITRTFDCRAWAFTGP